MKFYLYAIAFLFCVGVAHAQQPPQQSTVQQLMMQDANIKAVLSEQLDAAHKQVQQLTTENASLKKQIADKEKAKTADPVAKKEGKP